MKKIKLLSVIISILTILSLSGCNNDARQHYIGQLEELDRNDLIALDRWLDDNEESIGDLFEFVDIRIDLRVNELDFAFQNIGLETDYFDSWLFELDEDTIIFTYIWDYESSNAASEEFVDPLAADNERLVNWLDEDVIPQFEEIDVEDPLIFAAATGGFISGVRSTMGDLNASDYLLSQVEYIISFKEEVQNIVVLNYDSEDLDLIEVRDLIIRILNEIKDLLLEL